MSFWTRSAGIALIYAAFAAAWILGSGALLGLAIPDPVFASRIELVKGLAFVAVSSALLYGLLRVRESHLAETVSHRQVFAHRTGVSRAVPLLLLLALTVPMVAVGFFALNRAQVERKVLEDLKVVVALKGQQIENWLDERRGNANSLMESQGFIERVTRMQRDQDVRERELVRDRLASLQSQFGYETILLLDTAGAPLIAAGVPSDTQSHDDALLPTALASGAVQVSEMFRDAAGNLHLDFVAPLLLQENDVQTPVGAVLLHVNPNHFLYPLITAWPAASSSGETFLVRRDGESVLFLNELRHRSGTALTVRNDLAAPMLPAAVAVRAGRPGVLRGVDYRGVDVLAAYRPVPGTDWHLIAKLDFAEAIAPVRQLALWVGLMTFIAVAIVVATMLVLMGERQRNERLALEVQTDRLMKMFFNLPFIGMAITSPETKRWLQFNDRLCDILGYGREELAGKSWAEMTFPEDLDNDVAEFERVLRGESDGYVLDKRFIRKNGSIVYTTIDIKCARNPDGSVEHFICMVRDVTERREAEEKILNVSRMYATLSRCNSAIVHCLTEAELFAEVCRAAVESAGMKMAWIGIVDGAGLVQPVASSGAGAGYLDGIRISARGDEADGRGPTGTAIREGRPYWCQDFSADPATLPWHERSAQYGWAASASLPLRRAGTAVGAITLYSGRSNAFDQQTQKLLMEMAQDISFALDNFDREKQRRRAEQAVGESERRHRLIFDNSLDAVLLTAPDGRILAANQAACRMFERTEQEIIEVGRNGIVDATDPRVAEALAERARTGKFIGELGFVRKSGARFPGEVSTSIFQDSEGNARTSMFIRDITERRRAGELTRALLEQLEFYLKVSPVVSYALSIDGESIRSVWVSENIQRMAGYTPGEALAPDWWTGHVHPEDRGRAIAEVSAALAGTGLPRHEYRFRHKDGHYLWVLDTFHPVPDADGRGVQLIGAWNDITTEKELQESLLASEERFRVMFEQAPLGIALIDSLDGRIYEVNSKFAEIAGRARTEMTRIDWQSITHPDDIQADLDNMTLMNAGKVPGFSMKKRYLRPDGTVVWINLTVTPIRIAGAGIGPRHLAMIEDITESERMIQALESQEARFRALAEQSMVGIYTIDQGRVAYVNPRAADIYGYTPEEMTGRPAEDFVAPEDLDRVRENMRLRTAGEKDSIQYEFTGRRRDGSRVMIGVHGSTAVIGGRRVLMGVMQDITTKLRAEAAIQDYIARIERMISGTVNAISTMVELRDPYTAGHERRVGELSAAIAAEMGLDDMMQRGLRIAGAVHDVGKIAVPAEILSKPGRLTPAEFEMVKAHAQQGYEVLRGVESLWPIAEVARQHHERVDGSGYPRGLKGGEILLEARILAVADVVESMGSHRPYRPMLGMDKALEEIERNAGKLYDPQVAAACLHLFRDKHYVIPD